MQLNERHLWEPDYQLEFYGRRIILVEGELDEAGVLQVSTIKDTGESLIWTPDEEYQTLAD